MLPTYHSKSLGMAAERFKMAPRLCPRCPDMRKPFSPTEMKSLDYGTRCCGTATRTGAKGGARSLNSASSLAQSPCARGARKLETALALPPPTRRARCRSDLLEPNDNECATLNNQHRTHIEAKHVECKFYRFSDTSEHVTAQKTAALAS